MSVATTGRNLRCERCGAVFALQQLSQWVLCPHCRHQQQVPAELHAELQSYEQQVRHNYAAARHNHQLAAVWQQWTTSKASNPKKNFVVAYGLMTVPAVLLGLGATLVHSTGIAPNFIRGPGFSFAIMGVTYGGVVVYLVWYFSGVRKKNAQHARPENEVVSVACPNCGAPGVLTPGDAIDTCGYCRAALMPSRTAMMRAVDVAELTARRAEMEHFRQERQGMANVQAYSANNWLVYIVGGSFLMPIGIGALMFSVQMLSGEEPYSPAIFLLWAFLFALVGGMWGYYLLRKQRKLAFTDALRHVLGQLPGTLDDRLHSAVKWLNQYWSARYQTQFLTFGPHGLVACVDARGFPTLIYVDVVSSGQHHSPKLHLLVAAWSHAGTARNHGLVSSCKARLQQMGFEVSETDAGLFASATPETIKRTRKHPATLHELTPAVTTLTQLAEGLGRTPAQPIP